MGSRLKSASTYIKELHAVCEAIGKWRQYLIGRRFIIRTDHRSLKDLLCKQLHTPDQHHYIRKLLGYDFVIEYKPGSHNIVADALSRAPDGLPPDQVPSLSLMDVVAVPSCMMIQSVPISAFLDALRQDNRTSADYNSYHRRFDLGELSPDFTVVDGILLYRHKYFLTPSSTLKKNLL